MDFHSLVKFFIASVSESPDECGADFVDGGELPLLQLPNFGLCLVCPWWRFTDLDIAVFFDFAGQCNCCFSSCSWREHGGPRCELWLPTSLARVFFFFVCSCSLCSGNSMLSCQCVSLFVFVLNLRTCGFTSLSADVELVMTCRFASFGMFFMFAQHFCCF